jgi:hypothetical protein
MVQLTSSSISRRNNVVTKKILGKLLFVAVIALYFTACQSDPVPGAPTGPLPPAPGVLPGQPGAPQLPGAPGVIPPGVPPTVAPVLPPAAPPPTPLIPISEATEEDDLANKPKGKGGKFGGIDKALPGLETPGDELVGNYSCRVDGKGLSLGPLKLPEFGCRIYRADDGTLRLGPTSRSATSIAGKVTDTKATGFFILGTFKFPGNKMDIKARMKRKGVSNEFSGRGRGRLNDDKQNQIKYNLIMKKK